MAFDQMTFDDANTLIHRAGHNANINAKISAVIVRVEAGKAVNATRAINGSEPLYDYEWFDCLASEIESLASQLIY